MTQTIDDPNRIVTRVESLIGMATSAFEEAISIYNSAVHDNEHPDIIASARQIIRRFLNETEDAF